MLAEVPGRSHAVALIKPPSPTPVRHPSATTRSASTLRLGVGTRSPSAGRELIALFAPPERPTLSAHVRAAALLYRHGGWALDDADMLDCGLSSRRPFVDAPLDRGLRLLLPQVDELGDPHLACVGADDSAVAPAGAAATRAATAGVPLELVVGAPR